MTGEILVERNRIEYIVAELTDMLATKDYTHFTLRFEMTNGEQGLIIVPRAKPVEFVLGTQE